MSRLCKGPRPNRISSAIMEALESRRLLSVVPGAIAGVVFNDADASWTRGPKEAGLAKWQVYIDANKNGKLDKGELSTLSDVNGNWKIASLAPGNYTVREVLQSGWRPTVPGALASVVVRPGLTTGNLLFGNTRKTYIAGTVFKDANGNGTLDKGESGIAGVTVFADLNKNGKLDKGEPATVTDKGGNYAIWSLDPGTYQIREVAPSGYTATKPAGGVYTLSLGNAQITVGLNFGNKPGTPVQPPPPPPPPPGKGFVVTAVREVDPLNRADDLVTFYAFDPGTGALAGSKSVLAEDATLSSSAGLIIRTYGPLKNIADFSGLHTSFAGSYVSLGQGTFVVQTNPSTTAIGYRDLQTVPKFEVVCALLGGVLANSGRGAVIGQAMVAHGAAVSLAGQLGADEGATFNFAASA